MKKQEKIKKNKICRENDVLVINQISAKGITLVALVITILILLILVGISLKQIIGEKGIIEKANQSELIHEESQAKEKLELVLLYMQSEKATNIEYNKNEYLTSKIEENGMKVKGDIVLVYKWQFCIDRDKLKIEEIQKDVIGMSFSFGDNTNGYDGISGKCEEFIVPYTGYYKLEVWGAQGGSGKNGGYSSGYEKLQKGEKLYAYLGGKGVNRVDNKHIYLLGGFNGGGNSGLPSYYTPSNRYGAALRFRRRSNRYKKNKSFRRKLV